MCVDWVREFKGSRLNGILKSRLISGEFCSSLENYDGVLNLLTAWPTESCVMREQKVFVGQEFGAQKKL